MNRIDEVRRRAPGRLLTEGLRNMKKYMSEKGLTSGKSSIADPVVTTYLTIVLQPALGATLQMRSERELRTMSEALDCLLRGRMVDAAEILMQRFKAVETATINGNWDTARFLEAIPAAKVSSVAGRERELAIKQAALEQRLRRSSGMRER